ncbi:TorF family putative porin [Sulfurimonas sp.]|nr:TorF family putative porin [Sulfurimonas sp.]
MKLLKLSLAAAILTSTMAFAEESSSEIEISANVAMTSNYIWRGYSQTADAMAIQGGFDVSYNGFYIGTWGSNVSDEVYSGATMELDIYAGYAGEYKNFSYDVGLIEFIYQGNTGDNNFAEAWVTLGYDFGPLAVSGTRIMGINGTNSANSDTWEAGVSVPLPMDITFDATYGDYEDFNKYATVGLSKSFGKFDVSVMYAHADFDNGDKDEKNVVLTVGTSF